jgi:hypothetical protein
MNKERKIINQIKDKLNKNNAMITKEDKDNSIIIIIIIYQTDYNNKIAKLIENNNFTTENKDLTKKFQKEIRNNINQSQLIIPEDEKWKYVNLNPTPPISRGLIKVHKVDSPIRPVISWKNASTYKLAKLVPETFKIHIPLPYTSNIKNSVQLMNG